MKIYLHFILCLVNEVERVVEIHCGRQPDGDAEYFLINKCEALEDFQEILSRGSLTKILAKQLH